MGRKEDPVDRLVRYVVVDDDCWIWFGATTTVNGGARTYGIIRLGNGERTTVHRLVWVVFRGPIPPKHLVLQSCGNDVCVKPAHLYIQNGRRGKIMGKYGRAREHKVVAGQEYESWTVLKEVASVGGRRRCLCRCKCGTERIVWLTNLLSKSSKGCRACSFARTVATKKLGRKQELEEMEDERATGS